VSHPDFSQLPADLQSCVADQFKDFQQGLADAQLELPDNPALSDLPRVWAASEFVSRLCIRHPQRIVALLQSDDLQRDYSDDEYHQRLNLLCENVADNAQLSIVLRQFRNIEMLRLAWRDISEQGELLQILRELSLLAEACVQVATDKLYAWMEPTYGTPLNTDGSAMQLTTLGMGKLGAYELNYSSDIDLIFCFAHEGQTQGGRRSQSHSEFFTRLCRQLMVILDENTAEGFVFRTDARLRPFGDAGQLALSFDAMENYYEIHGREWERYAMVKARVISGATADGEEIKNRLMPFVYRRYLDYSSFESLRELKGMINTEAKRKGLENNVKTGPGGIREVEFITQAFQLIRGGREPRLQQRELLQVLPAIAEMDLLPDYVVNGLIEAYHFLRKTENRIQAFRDQQTHSLPANELEQSRLAVAMGFDDWSTFLAELERHRTLVHEHFQQVFAAPQAEQGGEENLRHQIIADLWQGNRTAEQAAKALQSLGFEDGAAAYRVINDTRNGSACRNMGPRGQKRMNALMPILLPAIAATPAPQTCLLRVAQLLNAIARRTVYLSLLVEHPMALGQLVRLCAISPWIAEQLSRYPILLDELLDPRRLYEPIPKDALADELRSRLSHIDKDDLELRMDILRQFKLTNVLRVAAAELTDAMVVEKVSDHLSFIAEVCLEHVVDSATDLLHGKHGVPRYNNDHQNAAAGFAVIGYGKLGGLELGFGSDLDVVFLHDSHGKKQLTDGDKQLENSLYFARLGQRITSLLNTQTASGLLYEVDTRLRPSGGAGLLVSNVEAFSDYQHKEAWVWEHQALVRARAVTGAPQIIARFNEIRREILCLPRDSETLRSEVVNMRKRMRSELDKSDEQHFYLKQGRGGIVDIEFIIQYMVLRWANKYPQLTDYPDNLRIIETLEETNQLSADDAKMLRTAYLAYRHQAHQLALQREPGRVDTPCFQEYREGVTRIWDSLLLA
jgi:glutamate-ammonia-ligase adenylyltransferase